MEQTRELEPLSEHRSMVYRPRERAWVVARVLPSCERVSATFKLDRYPSPAQAEKAAQTYRDTLEREHGPPPMRPSPAPTNGSLTGITGVSWVYQINTNKVGREYEFSALAARWIDPRTRAQNMATYSIKEHGLKGAFYAAAKRRRQETGEALSDERIAEAFQGFEAYWLAHEGIKPDDIRPGRKGLRDPNDEMRNLTIDEQSGNIIFRKRGYPTKRFTFSHYDSINDCKKAAMEYRNKLVKE